MATFTTDALVIGGGLMGMATMYSLGLRGVTATLVERNAKPGMETTARSGAIIRAHYGVPELVSLALDANRRYFRFADEVGYDCGFVESGYAVIVDESDKPVLHANVEMHRDLGVNVQLLSPWHIGQMVPGINTDDIAMVAYEPHAGYADPAKTVAAYTQRATELGARCFTRKRSMPRQRRQWAGTSSFRPAIRYRQGKSFSAPETGHNP